MIIFLWIPLTYLGKHFISMSFYLIFPSSKRQRAFTSRREIVKCIPKESLSISAPCLQGMGKSMENVKPSMGHYSEERSEGSWLISERVNGTFKLVLDFHANAKNFQIIYFFIKKRKVTFHFKSEKKKNKNSLLVLRFMLLTVLVTQQRDILR